MRRLKHGGTEWLIREVGSVDEGIDEEYWLEKSAFEGEEDSWLEKSAFEGEEDNWLEKQPADSREWIVAEAKPPAETLQAATVVLPNAGEGLRKSPIRYDLTQLEDFLCATRQWAVLGKTLCTYSPPCWVRLDEHAAEVEIRKCLRESGFTAPLLSSDYRELRKMLLLNPELQQRVEPTPPELSLNLVDGTLDVLNGEWRPHDPADGFFSFLDVTLQELSQGRSTGAFDSFVEQISGDDEEIRRQLLELVGLAVTGYSVKNFFVLVGPSHTGKSQFGRFLGELVGREYVETLRGIDDFGDKWTMGALRGKKLVMCLDLPDEPLPPKAIGMVKQLVGDDAVKGEYKGGSLFTFYDKPLLLCAGNYPMRLPKIEREQALLNRMVVIPFANPINPNEERQHFYRELLDDTPYIINCALDAVRDLAGRNFQITRVEVPENYQPQEGNVALKAVKAFLDICCEMAPEKETTTQELFTCFMASSYALKISEVDFSRLFSQAVQALQPAVQPVKRACGSEKRGYRGITLHNLQKKESI